MSKKRSRSKRASDSTTQPTKTIIPSVVTPKFQPHSSAAINSYVKDGFANFASRLGVNPGTDNQISEGFYILNLLTRNRLQLEAAYRGSWIVGAMVDAVAEDMTKAGIDVTTSEGAKNIQDFQAGMKRLQIWSSLCDVIKWSRLYGGAIGVLQIEGQDLSSPLRIETVAKGQFLGLAVYDRWQLFPDLTRVIPSGPDMGLPAYYTILTSADYITQQSVGESNNFNPNTGLSGGQKVHHSRIIRMGGVKLPFYQAITEQMWGMSELERIHDRLVSFDTATMSSANLINHANLRTVKVKDLREIMSSGGKAEEGLIKMFEYMRLLQSNEGITLLDGEDDFSSTAYSFAGLSDMMLQFGQQLSGASGIPLVRLFGQSPAGLNSTGESDIRNYYDNINAQQEANLRPGMDRLIRVVWQSLFGEKCPTDMEFNFTPLWQMTAKEKAEIGEIKTRTVSAAHESGLIKKSIAVKELRQSSTETGLFSNITDEDIEEAEEDDVPMPGDVPLEENLSNSLKATDSLFDKVMLKLSKRGKK
jgi:phage-related protein (TIGR01555 family)